MEAVPKALWIQVCVCVSSLLLYSFRQLRPSTVVALWSNVICGWVFCVCECSNNICLHCLFSTRNVYCLNLTVTPWFFLKIFSALSGTCRLSPVLALTKILTIRCTLSGILVVLSAAFIFHLFKSFFWPQYILCPSLLELLEEKESQLTSQH